MMENDNKNWSALSDTTLIKTLGSFVKHHRLEQNKTQLQLAEEAGINRTTLSLFENGVNSNLITFIQLLRALKLLHLLQEFQVKQQISPLQLAKLEQTKRIRARRSRTDEKTPNPKSDW